MASGSRGGRGTGQDIPRGLVNRTGTPLGRGSRLSSVRGQRDLTLGGIQRKVFTPNLVVKKKTPNANENVPESPAGTPSTTDADIGRGNRGRGRGDRGRGRGRGRGEDRTIQLQSEFSYGPMGGTNSGWARTSSGGGGGGGSGGGGGKSGGESATLIKASMRQSGTSDDKALLETLLRDDFISDISAGEASMAPIRLPLNINDTGVKQEIKAEIKAEPMDMDEVDTKVPEPQRKNMPRPGPSSVAEILFNNPKSENGELLVLQFPDTLPGLPATDSSESQPGPSNSSTGEDELSQRLNECRLHDCPEGYVGKLRLRRSGKVELVLGDNRMLVLPGIPINFHQELVSIRTDDSPGQMVALGPVEHKLVVTPDYQHLISCANTFS